MRPSAESHLLIRALLLAGCAAAAGAQAQSGSPPPDPAARCPAPSSQVASRPALPPRAPATSTDQSIAVSSADAVLGVSGDMSLAGDVQVRQGEREIRADRVQYDASRNVFTIDGRVQYRDPQLRVEGVSGSYSQSAGSEFRGTRFELPLRPARGSASKMNFDSGGRIELDDVTFTTCPADGVAWLMSARQLRLDTRARTGTGRNARIEFKGVPILYAPWISFPLGSERKSGFLFPNAGHSTRSGLQLTVPYYWNLRPNIDATFEPTVFSRRGVDLAGEVRWLAQGQNGSVEFNYLPNDEVDPALAGGANRLDRNRVRLRHRVEIPQGWRLDLDIDNVSDDQYFEDFAQGPEGTSVAFLERSARVSYRSDHLQLRGEFQNFQTIDSMLARLDQPYARLPRIQASGDWRAGSEQRFGYGFDLEVVNFERSSGVTGWRVDAAPRIGLDLTGAGYFLRPSAGVRFTQYSLDDLPTAVEESPARSLPFAMLDAGLQFERRAGVAQQRAVTLEPRVLYLYAPFRDQDDLPVFDSALPDLNIVQLFSTNRYVGADRVSDANQLSVGMTTRIFDADDGRQFLSATFGQTWYFETPRVTLPGEVPLQQQRSDLVAQLSVAAYRDWNIDVALQRGPDGGSRTREQLRLQYRPDAQRVVNFAYRFQRDRLEQGELSGAWPIGRKWNFFARTIYDRAERTLLERFLGLEYKSCCWGLRVVARRFVSSRTGERDTGIYLQLELNGLASVGTRADAFLQGAIRGYSAPAAAESASLP